MENNKYIESFLTIFLFKYGSFLKLNFSTDNLGYILSEEIDYINNEYKDYFLIYLDDNNNILVDYKDFDLLIDIDNDILKSVELLQSGFVENILGYININFSNNFKERISPFFIFLNGDSHKLEINIEDYILEIKSFKLKKMLLFRYYGIGNDTKYNTTKSINILSEIMEQYPKFVSFYLIRMRQTFNLVYKILIGVNKFNKLIESDKGKEFIYNNKFIKECFNDLEKADKLFKNYDIYYLFKGKFLLHLLDEKGLNYLKKYLELNKLLFDTNIFSWFGVYYLQVGKLLKSKKYLELVTYEDEDRYKSYSKLLFLYIKGDYKKEFIEFCESKDIYVLFYNRGDYYKFTGKVLKKWENIDDSYNHKDKMGFKINNFNKLLESTYENKDIYLNTIYNNISKNYYDHWSSELEQKLVFYSKNHFII